ncbi:MAG TPA: NUDIX hydrolase [bacterium]|nr:NUDIX hydrolase [bacterium]
MAHLPFSSAVRAELEALGTRYGVPRTHTVRLGMNRFLANAAATRAGEVCMVIRVASGGILAVTKDYYPSNVYRLPTGGIRQGEPVLEALRREVREETGLDSPIVTFLAIIGYHDGRTLSEFFTYAFLLNGTDEPRPEDPEERIAGFRVVTRDELPTVAARLEALPDDFSQEFERSWAEWGRFRGAAHRVVWEVLRGLGR